MTSGCDCFTLLPELLASVSVPFTDAEHRDGAAIHNDEPVLSLPVRGEQTTPVLNSLSLSWMKCSFSIPIGLRDCRSLLGELPGCSTVPPRGD